MNLRQHIKQVLNEEVFSELKKPFIRYEKLINKLVYMVFDEGICGFSWDVIKLHMRDRISIRIILHFTKDSFQDFDYERYGQSKKELKDLIEDFLPKFNGVFIVYDTTKCNDIHKEEETEGVGGYAAPAFEMEPDHVHFKHLYNESKLEKSIIRIIKEEANRKYVKPTPSVEKLIYRWLNDYFDGSQMYHDKSWETRHDFEWCNDGKEIMNIILFFHEDENVFDDKRKTEERDFESGELNIPKDIIDELNSDIPVRKNYLKYVIEEWFEDTYLETIQSKMGRNDISIDSFSAYPEKSQVCVPPVSKPEGVTNDEMIDFIVKNTLWKANDLIKREEETPGYIDKLYVDKLRQTEIERVRGR